MAEGLKKTLGIIGGMGPLATAELFYHIISLTDTDSDTGHIHILINNNPKIPDRTKAILEGHDLPYPSILETAQTLERMGADILLLPCNTSHVYYERLCGQLKVPVINMIEEAAKHICELDLKKVGLLATTGTIKAGLYEKELEKCGIATLLPTERGQAEVMSIIYNGVKAGAQQYDTAALCHELREMMNKGAQSFILGCTELPVAFVKYGVNFPFIDPGQLLAKAAIIKAGYAVKQK